MHIARLAGFANNPGAHALARADEMVVHRADRKQHGDGDLIVIHTTIGKDDDARAGVDRGFGLGPDAGDGFFQSAFAFGGAPKRGDRGGLVFAAD